MKNIWKIKPGSKRGLEDILSLCQKGDIISLSPGEYHFPKSLFLKEIEMIGVGKDPSEVVIKGSFGISGSIKVSISNVTINALHQNNTLNINKGATLGLKRVIVTGESTGNFPAIWCEQSNVNIEGSEIYFADEKSGGIYISEQSEVQIRSSIIDSITASQSNVQLHNNQINISMVIMNDSIVNSTGVLNLPTKDADVNDYFIYLQSGSKGSFNLIDVNANINLAYIEHSVFEVKEFKNVDNYLEIQYNAQATIDVPEENVKLINKEEFDGIMAEFNRLSEEIDGKQIDMDLLILEEEAYQEEHNKENLARIEKIENIGKEINRKLKESELLLAQANGITSVDDDGTIYQENKEEIIEESKLLQSKKHDVRNQSENIESTLDGAIDEEIYGEDYQQENEEQPSALEELQSLFGLHDLKKQINEFINIVKFNQLQKEQGRNTIPVTLHSIFMGNPGTGKTTVARILGRVLYETGVISTNKFVEVTRKDLVSPNIGETAQMTQQILDESKGGILFIDEAYSLYNESAIDHGREAIDTLLTFMEDNRHNTMIILAGYTDEMNQLLKMNSGFESRIKNKFYFDDYTPDDIAEIGYSGLIKQGYIVNEKKYKDIIKWLYSHSTDKSNARWVRNINEEILITHANRVVESNTEDTQTIMDEDLDVLTGNQQHDKEDMIEDLLNQLDSLIGLDEVKNYVHRLMQQAKVDRMLMDEGSVSSKPSYHMIFAGNPGTGKTTVANIIAKLFYYLDIMPTPNVKVVDRSDLVGPYIGHTEKQTKEILEQAMGGVLFIDEAYQLAGDGKDFGNQAIQTLLTYLENHRDKFVVILAGYTEEMDEFLNVNPGLRSRIPNNIIFPDYSPEDVATIVEKIIIKDWEVNVPLLNSTVIDIYTNLPDDEKANARWARNFSEKLIQNHKAWVADNPSAINQLKKINDEVIHELHQEYLQ